MDFEKFQGVDQIGPGAGEDEEKGGFVIRRENNMKGKLFKMSTKVNFLKTKVRGVIGLRYCDFV